MVEIDDLKFLQLSDQEETDQNKQGGNDLNLFIY